MNNLFKRKLRVFAWQIPLFLFIILISILGMLQVSAAPIALFQQNIESGESGNNHFYYLPIVAFEGTFDTIPTPPGPVTVPEIISFSASSNSIERGESADLNWQISGVVTAVSINNAVGDVTNVTTISVSPSETTTYEITASNSVGSTTAELTITVVETPTLPTINSFTASKTSINSGQKVTLSWEASNYETLRINQGIGNVANLTSIDVFPTAETTYRLRAINDVGEVQETVTIFINSGGGSSTGGPEIVVYDLNRKVTEADRGFPKNQPPMENGNWVTPYNYAGGTLYVRAQIKSQPVPQQDMNLQFCFWQELNGNNFGLETCITTENVPGTTGTVRCWSSPIKSMWKLNGNPLDWTRPRYRVAAVVKNGEKLPVSDYNGWNWNGENPKHWYPLDMRFTVIVVPKGSSFSGWDSYGGGC